MKYLVILAIWLIAGFSALAITPTGIEFFLLQGFWSLLFIQVVYRYYRCLFVYTLIFLEFAAIIINIGASIGFKYTENLFYTQYEMLLYCIDVLCIIAFIIWFPYNGALSGLVRTWSYIYSGMSRVIRSIPNLRGT